MKTNRWWRKERLATNGSAEFHATDGARGGRGNLRRMPPRMGPAQRAPRLKGYATGELGGVVCRRESEGFYDRCGGFSDSGRKVLIPRVMVAIVNISTQGFSTTLPALQISTPV